LRRALLLFAALALPGAAQDAPGSASWYAMVAEDGSWVGHGSTTTVARADGRERTDIQELRLEDDGAPDVRVVEETVTREDAAGRPVSIADFTRTGRSWSRLEAKIGATEARITRRTTTERREVRVPLPVGVRFDGGAGLLAAWDRKAALEFRHFNLDAMAVERVTIEPAPDAANVALRKRFDGGELRSVARLTLDPNGRIVSVVQPMFGTSVTVRSVSRDEALAPRAPYRVLRNAMVKSPFRIPPAAMAGHIRYRFAFRDGIAFAPPATGEQRVTLSPGDVVLDICIGCGPGLPGDPATLADALRPTPWLQSDHPRLKKLVAPVARLKLTDTRRMEMLLDIARGQMGRLDFVGHYSALETLERHAGDCTESAVLLAALGRAAGIPTKVVNGLAYSRARYHGVSNVFMPHSWTLAWVEGKWRSFDLALDSFDSSHIALTIGDGDARSVSAASQLAGLLRWESMTEVRTAPAQSPSK
jgi:hypothetical protein